MSNKTTLKYQFSRVPEITTATFQTKSESSDPNIIKTRDQLEEELKLWYMMFMDRISNGGHISVAELRRRAGLDISLKDYLFGFDEDCLAYTGNHGLELIKFHPIHLKQIIEPNYLNIDIDDLANLYIGDAEHKQTLLDYADITKETFDIYTNNNIKKALSELDHTTKECTDD